ncbi:MAG: hypothetical protein V4490_00875 [Pseudomonadota bacterium]
MWHGFGVAKDVLNPTLQSKLDYLNGLMHDNIKKLKVTSSSSALTLRVAKLIRGMNTSIRQYTSDLNCLVKSEDVEQELVQKLAGNLIDELEQELNRLVAGAQNENEAVLSAFSVDNSLVAIINAHLPELEKLSEDGLVDKSMNSPTSFRWTPTSASPSAGYHTSSPASPMLLAALRLHKPNAPQAGLRARAASNPSPMGGLQRSISVPASVTPSSPVHADLDIPNQFPASLGARLGRNPR